MGWSTPLRRQLMDGVRIPRGRAPSAPSLRGTVPRARSPSHEDDPETPLHHPETQSNVVEIVERVRGIKPFAKHLHTLERHSITPLVVTLSARAAFIVCLDIL